MPAAEHRPHQLRLRDVRVLVLVEQHGAEPVAVLPADLGVLARDLHRELDLVAEVDHAEVALQPAEHPHRPRELDALERGVVDAVGARDLLEHGQSPLDERDDVVGVDQVVRDLLVEVEDLVDHARLPLGLGVLERHLVEHAPGQRDALRLAQHAPAGLDARQHAVAIEHLGGEPVVVEDLGLLALGELDPGERAADAGAQVLGGLLRERQAEHVAGQHAVDVGRRPARAPPAPGTRRARPSRTSCPIRRRRSARTARAAS